MGIASRVDTKKSPGTSPCRRAGPSFLGDPLSQRLIFSFPQGFSGVRLCGAPYQRPEGAPVDRLGSGRSDRTAENKYEIWINFLSPRGVFPSALRAGAFKLTPAQFLAHTTHPTRRPSFVYACPDEIISLPLLAPVFLTRLNRGPKSSQNQRCRSTTQKSTDLCPY